MEDIETYVDVRRHQAALIESFINIGDYDSLLNYLESTLVNNFPRLYCPSSLVINVLFTLATLTEYNNADQLKAEFGNMSSDRTVSTRAIAIIQTIVEIVKNKDIHSQQTINGEPNDSYIEPHDIKYAQDQLIDSLSFAEEKPTKQFRSRALRQQNYYTRNSEPANEINSGSSMPQEPEPDDNTLDTSPQKRQLQLALGKLDDVETNTNFTDEADDLDLSTVDKKSFMILRHKRFDAAMAGERIFTAIQWAMHCSTSDQTVKRKAWEMWMPILDLLTDIMYIDLRSFKELQEMTSANEHVSSTSTEAVLSQIGRHYWARKFIEAILPLPKDKVQQIFPDELKTARSYHIVDPIFPEHGRLISSDAVPFLKKFLSLACEWSTLRTEDVNDMSFSENSIDDIVNELSLRIITEGDIKDLMIWFRLTKEDMANSTTVDFTYNHLLHSLVQITSYNDLQNELEEDFVNSEDLNNILILFSKTVFHHKFYDLAKDGDGMEDSWGYEKFRLDYNRLSILMLLLFNMWTSLTKPKLKPSDKQKILDAAIEGEKIRRAEIEHYANDEDYTYHHLTDLLKLQLSL